jgi:hypothetical protein
MAEKIMAEKIIGKVARVNSDRELVLNVGSDQGVREGQKFYVRAEPIEVTDPDSGVVLGEVSPIKVVVEVAEVAEKFSIARTFRTRRVRVDSGARAGSMLGSVSSMFQPPRQAAFETQVETLRPDPKLGTPIREQDSIVNRGDVVESVPPGENADPVTTTLFR